MELEQILNLGLIAFQLPEIGSGSSLLPSIIKLTVSLCAILRIYFRKYHQGFPVNQRGI